MIDKSNVHDVKKLFLVISERYITQPDKWDKFKREIDALFNLVGEKPYEKK